ncbi:MAG: signal recognition particle-docking protein FtsY [bacterium]
MFDKLKAAFSPKQWIENLKTGLTRTREGFIAKVKNIFRRNNIDEELWEELESILIGADVGVVTTERIIREMRGVVKERGLKDPEELTEALKEKMALILGEPKSLNLASGTLSVILVVGVNGTGKTTSIAKLAHRLKSDGKKVLVAAADTFRAAAIEQLEVWAGRVHFDVISHREGADPAAVVFDSISAAKARNADVLIVDTAGRLQTKVNLMEELKKVRRIITRDIPEAPHETLLVLDATTGQNALQQARLFGAASEVTGIVLCKLDGTAKGGIVLAISGELGIPVKFIGLGEKIEDLKEFDPRDFLEALFA